MSTPYSLPSIALGLLVHVSQALAALPSDGGYELVLQSPPASSVNSVAVSPDGFLVAAAAGEGGVRLYDSESGEMLRVLGDVGDRCVAFSPDGRTLTAAGFHMDKLVKLVDVSTGRILRTFAGHSEIETNAVAFSADGALLASACRDHEILIWDVASGALQRQIDGAPSIALTFSPDGRRLAAGCADKTVRVWDARTGELRQELEGHSDSVVTVAFSSDGQTIASGSCDWANHRGRDTANFAWRDPGCVSEWKLWDAASGTLQRTVKEPGRLLSLALASGNRHLLACAIGKDVLLFDMQSESPGVVISSHDFDATSVAFTPDGAGVISGSHDQTIKRSDLAGKVEWRAPGSWEQVNSVALSADGSLLATGSSDRRFAVRTLNTADASLKPGAARLWDARTGRLLRRLGDSGEQVMAVAISPGGRHVIRGGASASGAGVVQAFDAATGEPVWSAADHPSEVLAVAYSPDGSALAVGSADGLAVLRDPQSGSVLRRLEGHPGGATSFAFSPDGATLICGQGQGGTQVWDIRTGRLLQTLTAADSRAAAVSTDRLMTSVAFAHDGATFWECVSSVGNTYGERARLWDVRTGQVQREIGGGKPIVLSPDGTLLAAGGKTVSLKDAETGEERRRLTGYLKKVQSIAFSADGRLLFAGGSYGTTNVWEVATGRHLVTLFAFPQKRNGRVEDDWLAYHPDGYYSGSPGIEHYLAWRVGGDLQTPNELGARLHRPDRVQSALHSGQ